MKNTLDMINGRLNSAVENVKLKTIETEIIQNTAKLFAKQLTIWTLSNSHESKSFKKNAKTNDLWAILESTDFLILSITVIVLKINYLCFNINMFHNMFPKIELE